MTDDYHSGLGLMGPPTPAVARRALFLDIDGVLTRSPIGFGALDRELVHMLSGALAGVPDAGVVIHSSWRYSHSLTTIMRKLCEAGFSHAGPVSLAPAAGHVRKFSGAIIHPSAITEFVAEWGSERAAAIGRHLADHPEIDRYAILDDEEDMGTFNDDLHLIRTKRPRAIAYGDGYSYGIVPEDMVRLLRLLGV